MTSNPNELIIENSALMLIEQQPADVLAAHSADQGLPERRSAQPGAATTTLTKETPANAK
jgi:hypothetical protein